MRKRRRRRKSEEERGWQRSAYGEDGFVVVDHDGDDGIARLEV
jgi:hypothetical protein